MNYISEWCFILYTKKLSSAQRIMGRVFQLIELSPQTISYSSYEKADFRGYRVNLSFQHSQQGSWGDMVLEIIALGQKLGGSWRVYNDVFIQPSGILTDKDRMVVVGVCFIEWDLPNPNAIDNQKQMSNAVTQKSYWYKVCPLCHGQGRLVIYSYVDYDELFFGCDECMACWSNPKDIELKKNTFREFDIKPKYQSASPVQIVKHFGKDFQFQEYKN